MIVYGSCGARSESNRCWQDSGDGRGAAVKRGGVKEGEVKRDNDGRKQALRLSLDRGGAGGGHGSTVSHDLAGGADHPPLDGGLRLMIFPLESGRGSEGDFNFSVAMQRRHPQEIDLQPCQAGTHEGSPQPMAEWSANYSAI